MKPSKVRVKRAYHFAKQTAQAQEEGREQHVDVVQVDPKTGIIRVVHVVIRKANFAIPLCDALLGEKHPVKYRMATGVFVMAVGVTIAKTLGHGPYMLASFLADAVGYGLHGVGLIPFVDHLVEKFKHRVTE